MRILIGACCLLCLPLAGRDEANNLYDRQLDRAEQRMIVYYNRWLKYQKNHPCECQPCPECCCPCVPCPTQEERAYHFQD